jgi:hypothetical protein
MMRRKPAPNAFVLQISVEPLDKRLVLGRVTDEARMELDRIASQRWEIFDRGVG